MKSFEKDHPNIKVKFRATYEDYEDATQVVLREAVSNSLPDVTMQGLNRQAIFVEKGIAKSLEPFIAKEANFAKDGYHKAMLDLGTFNGKVHGLPFSVSLPVGYYNMDLMKKAGVSKLPTNWGEVISTCKKTTCGWNQKPNLLGMEHHR
jgi:multiple sugar transport system substrate-binding protein